MTVENTEAILTRDVKPHSSFSRQMLPSLGFLGATAADSLRIPVNAEITSIKVTLLAPKPQVLNIAGVVAFRDGKALQLSDQEIQIELSSNHEKYGFEPQGVSRISGIHTEREYQPWWKVTLREPQTIDELRLYNIKGRTGSRNRRFRIDVADSNGQWKSLLDSTSQEFFRHTLAIIEDFVEQPLSDRVITDLETAHQWRLDAVKAAWTNIVSGAKVPTRDQWIALEALIPTARNPEFGTFLEGNDWSLLAYILRLQYLEYPVSRSGWRPFGFVLRTTEDLDYLNQEIEAASQLLGTDTAFLSKHGLAPSGALVQNLDEYVSFTEDLAADAQALGVQVMIGYGTLLGAVREGGPIPHDDDIDLLIPMEGENLEAFERNVDAIQHGLAAQGWQLSPVPSTHLFHVSRAGSQLKLDLFAVWCHGETAYAHMEKMTWRPMPSEWFARSKTVTYGGYELPAPQEAEQFLEERYGPDWRIPDKYHEWQWKLLTQAEVESSDLKFTKKKLARDQYRARSKSVKGRVFNKARKIARKTKRRVTKQR